MIEDVLKYVGFIVIVAVIIAIVTDGQHRG